MKFESPNFKWNPHRIKSSTQPQSAMKKAIIPALIIVSVMTLFAGCSWSVGSGPKTANIIPTTGQQLIDMQRAKDSGAITDAEYEAKKAKLLGNK
jgi:hypothetical protein